MLAGWSAAPVRFREDANAEEDYALGGYRDRLVVELAQNAADAAVRAGAPGRLRLVLEAGLLRAANTGAALDAAGVLGLSTLRASAKTDKTDKADEAAAATTVGRFGVGFAAVRAVSDEPAIVSTTGAVRWSVAETRAAVTAAGTAGAALVAELRRRGGAVPALRLPFDWPDPPEVPAGFATEVWLPLRDAAAEEQVGRLLDEVDATLLLALPGLAELEIRHGAVTRRLTAQWDAALRHRVTVTVTDGDTVTRWCTAQAGGRLEATLLADRPAEERWRPTWSVRWAVPMNRAVPGGRSTPGVVRAPTPTDEPLSLPAVLFATFPLDPTRRHVAPGPLAEFIADRAGACYAGLVGALPTEPPLLSLVPVGLAAGWVDDAVRRAALDAIRELPLLPATGGAERQRPASALALDPADDALVAALTDVLPALVPAAWARERAALTALGVRRLELADVVDALGGLDRQPTWWRALYAALADAVPPGPAREALATLPVPLADGRTAVGPRGLALPGSAPLPDGLDVLGVRVVHPAAAHPLLASLGSAVASPRSLLEDARVRAAVAASYDSEDPEPVAEAVLGLVAAADVGAGQLPWLADLALPGTDGEWYAAGELLLPGGALQRWVVDDAPFGVVDGDLVARYGADVLRAVGVLDSLATVTAGDVLADPDATELDVDAEDDWLAAVAATSRAAGAADQPPVVSEVVAVRDLELVRDDAWPEVLAALAEPPLRRAVVEPARVLRGDGRWIDAPAYTAWWLARHARVDGRALAAWGTARLGGLYDVLPLEIDAEFLGAVGVVGDLFAADPEDLLARLADPTRTLDRGVLSAVYGRLARADVEPPDRLRAVRRDGSPIVVDAEDALVADAPWLLPLVGDRPLLPVAFELAGDLADALVVEPVSRVLPRAEPDAGSAVPWTAQPRLEFALTVAGGAGGDVGGAELCLHDALLRRDIDGRLVPVPWYADGGRDHVVRDDLAALGAALAWRVGRWPSRFAISAALDPDADPETLRREAGG